MPECSGCDQWFEDDDVVSLDCGGHYYCDDDCRYEVSWDCEHCGETGNCYLCEEPCKSCERDSDGMPPR
jgi:hypothetical protein